MAKRQLRISQKDLSDSPSRWLGQPLSVVLCSGAVLEILPVTLQAGRLLGRDAMGQKHILPLHDIKEIILKFPQAEAHAQTSAD